MSNFQQKAAMANTIYLINAESDMTQKLKGALSECHISALNSSDINQTEFIAGDRVLLWAKHGQFPLDCIPSLAKNPLIELLGIAEAPVLKNMLLAQKKGLHTIFELPCDYDHLLRYISQHQTVKTSFIAQDPTTLKAFSLAKQVSSSDASVLILGESGVGKEVLAKMIHQYSNRVNCPFVAINCAAIPDSMLEGILFGHEKGAFTGAIQSSEGKFEQANGGTILLDEISELPLHLQAKLLRVLQEKEVERLGGKKVISLDVRVLATSNVDLKKLVQQKAFREDLFFRLNVFPITLAPLRERKEDIVPLMLTFISNYSMHDAQLSIEAKDKCLGYHWPGNIRELNNVIQRACILAEDTILSEHIQFDTVLESKSHPSLYDHLKHNESEIIIQVLNELNGNRKATAEKLGISPRTLRYKISQLKRTGQLS